MTLVSSRVARGFEACSLVGAMLLLLASGCSKSNTVNASGECAVDEECIDDGNPCSIEQCDQGVCKHPVAADQSACPGGACWNGECCQGCYNGTLCKSGTDFNECGRGGFACDGCDDGKECTSDACASGTCTHAAVVDETKCSGGTCRGGACCEGCWNGTSCVAGSADATACGTQGSECVVCDDSNPCTTDACEAGACHASGLPDQSSCPDGRCWGMQCCIGCYDGTSCMTGDQLQACGTAGSTCLACDDGKECTTDACAAGVCTNTDNDGAPCSGGVCLAGSCVCGSVGQPCCGGGTCNAVDLACAANQCSHCGADGEPCCATGAACSGAASACILGQCAPCGGAGEACCTAGAACEDPQLACLAGQCVHCGLGAEPCCGGTTCTGADLLCQSGACQHCGLPSEPCCAGATCTGSSVLCIAGACASCGGANEPCCAGGSCSDVNSLVCASNSCVACGGANEPCCDAPTACTSTSTICDSGSCKPCGGAGQPCCASSSCDAWLACDPMTHCAGCAEMLSVGPRVTCAVRSDGKIHCVGLNGEGMLGTTVVTTSNVGLPISFSGTPTALSVGLYHACVIGDDGAVWCWGSSLAGALGPGATETENPIPLQVPLPSKAVQLSVSQFVENATCAVLDTHEVYCWGDASGGNILGIGGPTSNIINPMLHPYLGADNAEVVLGYSGGCARKLSGALYCWGLNNRGQVGDGSVSARYTPVHIALLGTSVSSVTLGENVTCARHANGSIWCWGMASLVGDGSTSTTPKPSPNELTALGNDNLSAHAGRGVVCVRKSSGALRCWGKFDLTTTYSTPQTADTALSPAVDAGCGDSHCCSLVDDGRVWCIGTDGTDGSMGALPTPPYWSTVADLDAAVFARFPCQ